MAVSQLNSVNPPVHWPAEWSAIPDWLSRPPNPWLLINTIIAALFAVLGAWAAIGQLRAPQSATKSDVDEIKTQLREMERRMIADPSIAESTAQGFAQAAEELVQSGDPLDRAVASKIAKGNPVEAADQLMVEARADRVRNARRFFQAGRIYAPFAPKKAMNAYGEAVELNPEDVWSWIHLGRLRAQYESLESAERCFQIALQRMTDDVQRSALETELGQLAISRGDLESGREHHASALAIDQRLAAEDLESQSRQHFLAISYMHLSEVVMRLGDHEEAARLIGEARLIWAELIKKDRTNFDYLWGIYSSGGHLADLEYDRGDLENARDRYEESQNVLIQLIELDAQNTQWVSDLSVGHRRLGEIERRLNDNSAARERFELALSFSERLVEQDPDNRDWQNALSLVYNQLGDLDVDSGDFQSARKRYQRAFDIRTRLVALEPNNSIWQHGLFVSNTRFAMLDEASGNLEAALRRLESAERIIAALVHQSPGHPHFDSSLKKVRSTIRRLRGGQT